MYYHCREIKYVEYGKVFPPPEKSVEEDFLNCYKWLGKYCGYCPQVWLSKCNIRMTGYRKFPFIRQYKESTNAKDLVLFGFDYINGFPVDYDMWEFFMGTLMSKADIGKFLLEIYEIYRPEKDEELFGQDVKIWNLLMEYQVGMSFDYLLKKYLFVENDQFVVPSLNLKSAKKIVCKDEKMKKKLLKLGFIEDRVEIRNAKDYR